MGERQIMSVTINGRRYEGNDVTITNGKVVIDGKEVESTVGLAELKIKIEGGLASLKVDRGNVECGEVAGSIWAGGSISCHNVTGNAEAGGSVSCKDVGGNVDAGGSVSCGKVGGDIDAGGSVKMVG